MHDRAGTGVGADEVIAWAAMERAEVPELEPQPFDVRGLIDAAGEHFAEPARQKGIVLEVRAAPSVPSRALGEARWLREVLHELIDNAVRFTDDGEVVASVTTDRTGGSRVLLHAEVSDTGRGMSAETVAALFRPSGPGAVPRDALGASGSLQVVRRLVDLMDGRIGACSALGMGTTIWFTVPLDPA